MRELPDPSHAPPAPQVQGRSLEAVVDSGEVEYAAQESHTAHMGASHALRPRVRYEEAIDKEVTLRRVEVDLANTAPGALEESVLRLAAGSVPFSCQQVQQRRYKSP